MTPWLPRRTLRRLRQALLGRALMAVWFVLPALPLLATAVSLLGARR